MPQAAIVEDRAYYAFDVYEERGRAHVKIMTVGPFLALEEDARQQLRRVKDENAPHQTAKPRRVVSFRYVPSMKRWQRWG